jgi:hypothetical protein
VKHVHADSSGILLASFFWHVSKFIEYFEVNVIAEEATPSLQDIFMVTHSWADWMIGLRLNEADEAHAFCCRAGMLLGLAPFCCFPFERREQQNPSCSWLSWSLQ